MGRVLIACEYSGITRRAFAARGHDVWSCDLLPAEDGSNRHIICDVRDLLNDGWDLLALMHPPCTRLCKSGLRWLHVPPPGRTLAEMYAELDEAAALFSACWNAPIKRKCLENPQMHKMAQSRIKNYRPPAQVVQPWWFGDPEFKGLGLFLDGLPPLIPTNRLIPPPRGTDEWKAWSRVHRSSGWVADRWKDRSRSFPGVADAMAEQWGRVLEADPFIQGDLFEVVA